MKYIILGDGMLGTYLSKYLLLKNKVLQITRKDIDFISEESEIIKFFEGIDIGEQDVIVNCIGIIKQRNFNKFEAIRINSLLPHILNKISKKLNCNFIHITTDCVFNGNKGFYDENHPHDAEDDYGRSKSLGEGEHCSIRTSIIGEEIKNKLSLIEWAKSNKGNEVNGYENHIWNGVTCLELSKFIEWVVDNKKYWIGSRHFFSEDLSKFDLLHILNDVYDLNLSINQYDDVKSCKRNLKTIFESEYTIKSIKEQIIDQKKFKI
jgi:dTDP-4-dehydrorhamnose reductase